jgi:hypothetical protein
MEIDVFVQFRLCKHFNKSFIEHQIMVAEEPINIDDNSSTLKKKSCDTKPFFSFV